MGIRLTLFFAQSFLLISSVSTEQSQICLRSTVTVEQEQGDLLWQSNLIHISREQIFLVTTPTSSIEILAQENLLQKHKERVEKLPQPDRLINICTDTGFLKTVEVGQCFMTKHTDEFLQFAAPLTCREYLSRDEKLTDRKVSFKGTPKFDPCWKLQPVTFKVNMEWK